VLRRRAMQRFPRRYLRQAFHRTDQAQLIVGVSVASASQPLLGAQHLDELTLMAAQHLLRQDLEIPEHPQQLDALHQRGRHVARTGVCGNLQHSVTDFLHPHNNKAFPDGRAVRGQKDNPALGVMQAEIALFR